jgi:hypothetical protein
MPLGEPCSHGVLGIGGVEGDGGESKGPIGDKGGLLGPCNGPVGMFGGWGE